MSERTRTLSFNVTGEFVTKVAREWFWLECKPWITVQEFLLSCMCGTDQTEEELIEYARKVVYGQAKFIGHTADGSYALVEDDKDLVSENYERLLRNHKRLEKDYRELEDRFNTLVDYLSDSGRGYLVEKAFLGETDDNDSYVSPLVKSFVAQNRIEKEHEDNYGWLAPNGTFYPVEWGEHQGWAHTKVAELGLIGDDDTWVDRNGEKHFVWTGEEGDILVDRGWVLLHNPAMGVALVTANDARPLTKAQKEFLYGYYMDRGLAGRACEYMED